MKDRVTIRYSEAFKLEVVEQISSGHFASPEQARIAYGIKGCTTVYRWLQQYGREDLKARYVKVMSKEALDETQELKKRVRELERALADAHMLRLLEKAHLDIACEWLGTDRESFKKKHVTTLSDKPGAKGAK